MQLALHIINKLANERLLMADHYNALRYLVLLSRCYMGMSLAKSLIVSRHPATIEWLQGQLARVDMITPVLPTAHLREGDCVFGNVSAHLIAKLSAMGVRYFHVELNLPLEMRGQELTGDDLEKFPPKLTEIRAEVIRSAFVQT